MPATYEPIATTTLGSAAATISFTSISSAYTDLRLVINASLTANAGVWARFNNDSGSNYSDTTLEGNGTSATSARNSNNTEIPVTYVYANQWSFGALNVFSYAGSTNKTSLTERASDNNGSGEVLRAVSLWRNTAAINRIDLILYSGQFKIGTTATLYGIKNA